METKLYQIHYLFTPELSEDGGKRWVEKLHAIIQKLDGHVVAFSEPARESLAYPVGKKKIAVRLRTECELKPNMVDKLLQELKHEQDILRIFVLVKPKETPRPIPSLRPRQTRPQEDLVSAGSPGEQDALATSGTETVPESSPDQETVKKEKIPLYDIDKQLEELLK